LIDRLSFLKGGADGGTVSPDEERLMQLFQNRAGLKKAYADLKDEFHLLRDRLKQQEGATIRVQEQLDALGDLLGDPKTGFGALVFFQLRTLWKTCHQQLSTFATDLTRQQEAREVAKHKAETAAEKGARLADVDRRLQEAATEADLQRRHLADAQSEIGRLTAFWHYFKRRRRQKSLESLRNRVVVADAAVGDLHAERSAIDHEAAPEFPGISLAARRNINLAIISFAELLCEHVDAYGLAARAKEAVARRVHEMSFGTRADCEGYMQRVQQAQAAVANQKQVTGALKAKLDRLRATCAYRNNADTVPTADSLAPAVAEGDAGRIVKSPAAPTWNVLAEDYWDLYTLLLR
jgi:DNA repair exonuclease SbcCD ATPase subunit